MSHQGNDFQITQEFWEHLNALTARYDEPGRFVIFPGYEWSGNTGLGGDRNVLYLHEGRPLHRSSHALVDDLSDLDSDANSADALFQAIKDEDAVVFAHIGGRYADITLSHDPRIE
ncbi:PF12228 domain protein, partial [Bordetella pertussis B200]